VIVILPNTSKGFFESSNAGPGQSGVAVSDWGKASDAAPHIQKGEVGSSRVAPSGQVAQVDGSGYEKTKAAGVDARLRWPTKAEDEGRL
jgi:hypothetical protein